MRLNSRPARQRRVSRRRRASRLPAGRRRVVCRRRLRHDLLLRHAPRPGRPVAAALRAYEALAEDGTVMVVEPFA